MLSEINFAIVGATGVVGKEAIGILRARGVPASHIRTLASERSAGTTLRIASDDFIVQAACAETVQDVDVVLHCADADTSKRLTPIAAAHGAIVVDNSSAYRLNETVPLVIPEVNSKVISENDRIIANPNCSTVLLLMALTPLRQRFGVRRIHVTTYQAVSGAGQAGIDDLHTQLLAAAAGSPATPRHFQEPCLGNVFSHDSQVETDTGVNGEERKIIEESRKIWNDPMLEITPTCVRVPVVRAHTLSICVELDQPVTESQVRRTFEVASGIQVVDDRFGNRFPTPLKASDIDDVLVGRIRPDPGERPRANGTHTRWCLLACGDQVRKGAALNAVQIAEYAIRNAVRKASTSLT